MDSGIGIPTKKIDHIFDSFTQADVSTTRKYGGTGLGLAITKQLIHLMGGDITVESKVDRGSTFFVEIPFKITDKLHKEKFQHKIQNKNLIKAKDECKILIAEDNPMNQLLMNKLLESLGIKNYTIVDNGVDAVALFKDQKFDLILMDCHMPLKNGYDTTIAIRKIESKKALKRVGIVAMTANAMLGDREKCLQCGMDDYISKPIDFEEFKAVLSQWIDLSDVKPMILQTSSEDDSPKATPAIDFSILKTISNGDITVQKSLISTFIDTSSHSIDALKSSYEAQDHTNWKEAAHHLRGGAGGIGAKSLEALSAKAQYFEGTDEEKCQLYEKIEKEFMLLQKQFKQKGLAP